MITRVIWYGKYAAIAMVLTMAACDVTGHHKMSAGHGRCHADNHNDVIV